MNINILSREQFTHSVSSGQLSDDFIISISDHVMEEREIRLLCKDSSLPRDRCLFLHFSDTEDDDSGFRSRTAHYIIEHAKTAYKERRDVTVHCLVGQSRSGAVAKFINDYWGLDSWYLNEYKGFNLYVYDILCKVFNEEIKFV